VQRYYIRSKIPSFRFRFDDFGSLSSYVTNFITDGIHIMVIDGIADLVCCANERTAKSYIKFMREKEIILKNPSNVNYFIIGHI
jgi:hypothetical protein